MNFIEEMRAKAKSDPRKLVLPEGYEPRTLKAARIILDEGFASEVTLLGTVNQIEAEAKKQGVSLSGPAAWKSPAASSLQQANTSTTTSSFARARGSAARRRRRSSWATPSTGEP